MPWYYPSIRLIFSYPYIPTASGGGYVQSALPVRKLMKFAVAKPRIRRKAAAYDGG